MAKHDEVLALEDGVTCRVWYFDWRHIDGFLQRSRKGDWVLSLSEHLTPEQTKAALARCRRYIDQGISKIAWPNREEDG